MKLQLKLRGFRVWDLLPVFRLSFPRNIRVSPFRVETGFELSISFLFLELLLSV